MALSKIDAANFLDGTLPDTNINNASLDNVTALPGAIPTGKVLQVVQDTLTSQFSTSSSTYADTGLTASITPSSTSNKILILLDMLTCTVSANANNGIAVRILRDTTEVFTDAWFIYNFDGTAIQQNSGSFQYTDSPSSTSSLTYKVQLKARTNSASINPNNQIASMTLMEIAG